MDNSEVPILTTSEDRVHHGTIRAIQFWHCVQNLKTGEVHEMIQMPRSGIGGISFSEGQWYVYGDTCNSQTAAEMSTNEARNALLEILKEDTNE